MLIVIEGVDGSGKQTHTDLLCDKLNKTHNAIKITFPNYNSPSSSLVKMYLNGEFGNQPNDVNTYAASTFYAVDRYASYKTTWSKNLTDGDIVIADRYVTSNIIHQGCKLDSKEMENYVMWLEDLEYNKMGLPRPDLIIFLDMPPKYGEILTKDRVNKITGNSKKDIHEKNKDYIIHSYNTALCVAKKYNWNIINCVENDEILPIDTINDKIFNLVQNKLLK